MNAPLFDHAGIKLQAPDYYSGDRDCWATPPSFVRRVEQALGCTFTLDACCFPATAKAPRFFTAELNGLEQSWADEVVWCNPPYSKGASEFRGFQGIAAWAYKAGHEAQHNGVRVVMLTPSDLRSEDRMALTLAEHRLPVLRRVRFIPPPGIEASSPNFGVDLHLFGPWPSPPKYL